MMIILIIVLCIGIDLIFLFHEWGQMLPAIR